MCRSLLPRARISALRRLLQLLEVLFLHERPGLLPSPLALEDTFNFCEFLMSPCKLVSNLNFDLSPCPCPDPAPDFNLDLGLDPVSKPRDTVSETSVSWGDVDRLEAVAEPNEIDSVEAENTSMNSPHAKDPPAFARVSKAAS
mmetsp:Transcript_15902/g.30768  ORF Transcript_15902/g.30768 Transcript_15902/m.30768 type:complete len:143 (+) Transcript_15902:3138-3566(+)